MRNSYWRRWWRPYETDETRAREVFIAKQLAHHFHLYGGFHLSPKYSLDYALLGERDRVDRYATMKWVEIKGRRLEYGCEGGVHLALSKVMKGRQIHQETGLPCHFAVMPTNGHIYMANLFDHDDGSFIFGRTDRTDDPDAIEPCVSYPWHVFEEIDILEEAFA